MTTLARCIAATVLLVASAIAPPSAEAIEECEITYQLETTTPVTLAQILTDYSAVQGTFRSTHSIDFDVLGPPTPVLTTHCEPVAEGTQLLVTASCTDSYDACQWGDERTLRAILSSSAPLSGSVDIIRCTYDAAESPAAQDFAVTLETAMNLLTNDLPEDVTVSIRSITCTSV